MARHTRYPAGKNWLPEFFKQEGANTGPYQPPTPEQQANQWIRMFVDRKISFESMYDGVKPILVYLPEGAMQVFLDWQDSGEEWTSEDWRERLRPFAGRVW